MVSADRKSTKEVKLNDSERIRRIVLPANHWGDFSANLVGVRSQELTDILRVKLQEIAGAKLRDSLAADPMLKLVPLSEYSIPALLTWSNETAGSRGSITFTRDEVTAWFATSVSRETIVTKHASNPKLAAILSLLESRFGALAAKNHGLKDEDDAKKLVALISEKDLEGERAAITAAISARLEHIIKSLKAKAEEQNISMDDI